MKKKVGKGGKKKKRSSLSISLSTSCCLTLSAFAILPQTFLISIKSQGNDLFSPP
jgi:hypothetical protein